jgi:hypothetical protein
LLLKNTFLTIEKIGKQDNDIRVWMEIYLARRMSSNLQAKRNIITRISNIENWYTEYIKFPQDRKGDSTIKKTNKPFY